MRLLLSVMLLVGLPALQASAQSTEQSERAETGMAARFQLADTYLQARQFDRAVAILEDLLADYPGSQPVVTRLKEAYVGADRVRDAVTLVEGHIGQHGGTAQLYAELGALYVDAGESDRARAAWRRAVEEAPSSAQTYRLLYSVMVRARMWEDARDLLLRGRKTLGQPTLFRIELAELYGRSDQHAEALEEWAELLAESPERLSFIQGRLGRMLDQEGVATAFRTALDRLIRRDPMRMPFRRLAAWMAAEDGDFDAGLDHTRAIDRLGQERGESLLTFAEAALQASEFDVAGRAFDIILDTHPQTATAAAALLSSGLLHERLAEARHERRLDADTTPHYDKAASRYRRFIEDYPRLGAVAAARKRLALIERDVYRDYEATHGLLEQVIREHPDSDQAVEARFALADLYLLQDDLTQARITLTRIENQLRIGERAERARYNLALLDFYEGNLEMALSRVNAMKRNTATDVANNAIDLKLILAENQGPDTLSTALRAFATAELRARQQRHDEALAELDAIVAANEGHAIIPLSRFRRAEALRALGRADEALGALTPLADEFPESYLADRSLFLVAEIHQQERRDTAAAIDAYTNLLMRYPGSLLAPEARTRIRQLRGDRSSS